MTNVIQTTESLCLGNIEENITPPEQEMFKLEQEIMTVFAKESDKHGIPRSVIDKIPVCPSSSKCFKLPGTDDWMVNLLIDYCRPHSRKHMSDVADDPLKLELSYAKSFMSQYLECPCIGKILDFASGTFYKQCYK